MALSPVCRDHVLFDDDGTTPVAITHPADPHRRHLLTLDHDGWHSSENRWGSGFILTDRGSGRWNVPQLLDAGTARHEPIAGITLTISRSFDDEGLRERYTWTNGGSAPISVTTLGISTPFRDVYDSAADSLRCNVHAHVWTGGADAWVISRPMSGEGACLVLRVVDGALHGYSIESRNQYSSSNVRGHIVLHPVDRRAPHALGGQEAIVLAAGESTSLEWVLSWALRIDDAIAVLTPETSASQLSAEVGTWIDVTAADVDARVLHGTAELRRLGGRTQITAARHGESVVALHGARIGYFFHAPIADLVRARVRFILDRQRPVERDDIGAGAFVPFDTRTGLTQLTSGWPDWSDGAERIGMAALLQSAVAEGWMGEDAAVAVRAWIRFARERLLDETAAPLWGSRTFVNTPRLYNAPWLVRVLIEQSVSERDPALLALALTITDRTFELGGGRHLSIGQPESLIELAGALAAHGDYEGAAKQYARLHESADYFATLGENLPAHEVNYEQSMIAPLVSLFALSLRERPGDVSIREALERAVDWLERFAGPQPHARLRGIAIRHWDGYWFGADRRWGDVFPHYWSVLTAVAWDQLPDDLREPRRAEIEQIFRANLVSFHSDGSATSAFIFPTAIDGTPAHVEDPLINDQDWALALMLRSRWFREQA